MRGSEGRFGPGRPVLSMPSNPRGYVLRIWPEGKGNGMSITERRLNRSC
jgi:hypothetical protein